MNDLAQLLLIETPGVYILRDSNGCPTYVGQSVSVGARIASHAKNKSFSSACVFTCDSENLSDIEALLIKALCPPENSRYGTPNCNMIRSIFWVGSIPPAAQKTRAKSDSFLPLDGMKTSERAVKTPPKVRHNNKDAQGSGNPHRRIPAGTVQQMCGDVSAMTLHRWLKNPDLDFPKPQYIGRRRYWREADIIAWLDANNAKSSA